MVFYIHTVNELSLPNLIHCFLPNSFFVKFSKKVESALCFCSIVLEFDIVMSTIAYFGRTTENLFFSQPLLVLPRCV